LLQQHYFNKSYRPRPGEARLHRRAPQPSPGRRPGRAFCLHGLCHQCVFPDDHGPGGVFRSLRSDLASDVLEQALQSRPEADELVHHSRPGSAVPVSGTLSVLLMRQ